MVEKSIRLTRDAWAYDDEKVLGGPGGFGEVFCGWGSDGPVAIKRLKITAADAAHRELAIGNQLVGRDFEHVVPILDAGQDAESERYFLVMPICEESLQDRLAREVLAYPAARDALLSIIAGLQEVGDLVHRDLKPQNVLCHEGSWKIADFGIAKFVEDSTSLATLRESLTPAFAAPEQWRNQRPEHATDIYALGCIAYALLTGSPPFVGSYDDVREGHLHGTPNELVEAPARVSALVAHMLRKSPQARPSIERCERILRSTPVDAEQPQINSIFLSAARQVAQAAAAQEAKREEEEAARARRQSLYEEAKQEIQEIVARLYQHVLDGSESAAFDRDTLYFGDGRTFVQPTEIINTPGKGGPSLPLSGWDVVAWSSIRVGMGSKPGRPPYDWSATLLFTNRGSGKEYRWYEVSFWSLTERGSDDAPHALAGHNRELDIGLSRTMGIEQVAFGPRSIDAEDEETFRARWLYLISLAAQGALSRPDRLPVTDSFFPD